MVTALNSSEICRDFVPFSSSGKSFRREPVTLHQGHSHCSCGLWKDLHGAFKLELAGSVAQGGVSGEWSPEQSGTNLSPFLPSPLVDCSKNVGFPFCS